MFFNLIYFLSTKKSPLVPCPAKVGAVPRVKLCTLPAADRIRPWWYFAFKKFQPTINKIHAFLNSAGLRSHLSLTTLCSTFCISDTARLMSVSSASRRSRCDRNLVSLSWICSCIWVRRCCSSSRVRCWSYQPPVMAPLWLTWSPGQLFFWKMCRFMFKLKLYGDTIDKKCKYFWMANEYVHKIFCVNYIK